MPSTLEAIAFREPSGRRHALVMFASALAFVGLYVYAGRVGDASSSSWLLVVAAGNALSAVAESLPKRRRRAAGALRVTAILVLAGLLVAMAVAPELVV